MIYISQSIADRMKMPGINVWIAIRIQMIIRYLPALPVMSKEKQINSIKG